MIKFNKPKTGQESRLVRHEGGPKIKRGCLAKFLIKQFYLWPLVAQITDYHISHTDKYGLFCHEIVDNTSVKEKLLIAQTMDIPRHEALVRT